ncbi:MAG: prephenate dehydratase [Ignavibacteriales bacterium]|nr:prephenate dehydratase [Ignavibacteriales bacterium]
MKKRKIANPKSQIRNRFSVAFQGEHGAFSEHAALNYFSKKISTFPFRSFDEVFKSVQTETTKYGIIPIENSLGGSIHQNYDLLERYNLKIVGEIKIRVVHSLIVHKGTSLKNIRFIYSHPQALAQCELFLKKMKNVEAVAVYDTAGAAKFIKEENRHDAAAIANAEAATLYGLSVLKRGIESNHHNYTRFLILSRKIETVTTLAKTSIVFSMKDIPGALFKALSVFALRDINLHKIESRPIMGKPWEYLFYIDFEGNVNDSHCKNALRHLSEITHHLKILGCYPEGKTMNGTNA